jgi:hypothetical protein
MIFYITIGIFAFLQILLIFSCLANLIFKKKLEFNCHHQTTKNTPAIGFEVENHNW